MGILDNILGGQQQAAPNMPGILAPQKGGILGISGPTLMALGAGIASGDTWGEGIGRGFGLASDVKEKEQTREAALEPLRMTYKSLVADGVSPQNALLQTVNPGLAKTRDEKKRTSDWQKMLLGKAPATGAISPVGDFASNLRAAESDGDDAARNPNSTATGRYQFIDSTWKGLMERYPQLGLTADGRTDPAQQEKAMAAFTSENTKALTNAGIPATAANLHSAHFLGAGAATKVLSAPDDAQITSYVGQDAIAANPFLNGMTVGDFKQWAAGKQGGQPVQTAQSSTGGMVAGLTNRQRTLVAAAGPDKGLSLLVDFQAENAKNAKTTSEKAKALNATKSLLTVQFPDQPAEWIDAVAASGQASAYISQALRAPKGAVSPVGKLAQDLKAGVITQETHDMAAAKATALPKGISIRTNPDGTMEFVQGGSSAADLRNPTLNRLEDIALNAAEMGGRLNDIAESFDPRFLTIPNRLGNLMASGWAKIDPTRVSPEAKQDLQAFSTFRRRAIDNINRVLKELSGGAITTSESGRLRQSLPDPGEGIFDGQDPITFKANLDDVLLSANKALVRAQFYKETGLPTKLDDIPLTDIKRVGDRWQIKKGDRIFEWVDE